MNAKTGQEYRYKAKNRQKKYREEQERHGYRSISVYLSEGFRAELERLNADKGYSKQDAMDYILEIYNRNVTSLVTKMPETPANKEPVKNTKILNAIDNFILDRHKDGQRGGQMTLKEIAQGLMDAGIKTISKNDTWKPGTVDTAFRSAMKRQSKEGC